MDDLDKYTWVAWNILNHQPVTTAGNTMQTNGLLRVQKNNPLDHRKTITYLTTIIPSIDADKKEWIDENMKGTKYIICVFAHSSYIFLKYLGSLRPSSKTNSGFCFLNCIQEFIQINILLIKMSRYHVSSLTPSLFPSYYKTFSLHRRVINNSEESQLLY